MQNARPTPSGTATSISWLEGPAIFTPTSRESGNKTEARNLPATAANMTFRKRKKSSDASMAATICFIWFDVFDIFSFVWICFNSFCLFRFVLMWSLVFWFVWCVLVCFELFWIVSNCFDAFVWCVLICLVWCVSFGWIWLIWFVWFHKCCFVWVALLCFCLIVLIWHTLIVLFWHSGSEKILRGCESCHELPQVHNSNRSEISIRWSQCTDYGNPGCAFEIIVDGLKASSHKFSKYIQEHIQNNIPIICKSIPKK